MAINPNLPEFCYAYIDDLNQIALIQRGVDGYRVPINIPDNLLQDASLARAWIDKQNSGLKVSPAQREAMVSGSMFGWHLPLADPAVHKNAMAYLAGRH